MPEKSFPIACFIVALLLCVSSIPVSGQESTELLIAAIDAIPGGGELSLLIHGIKLVTPILGESYDYYQGSQQYDHAHWYYSRGAYSLSLIYADKCIDVWNCAPSYITAYYALSGEPDLSDAWSLKGAILSGLGRHMDAIECCDRAIKIDPSNVYAWNNKGIALRSLGLYEEAIDCFDNAITIDPSFSYAINNKYATIMQWAPAPETSEPVMIMPQVTIPQITIPQITIPQITIS